MCQVEQLCRIAHFGFRSNAHVNADRKAREPRGSGCPPRPGPMRPAGGRWTCDAARRALDERLERVAIPAETHACGGGEEFQSVSEENKMAAVRDGANQMRNARVMQRLASPDPTTGERLPIISRILSCETGWLESGCKISYSPHPRTGWGGPCARRSFCAMRAMVRVRSKPQGERIMRSKPAAQAGIRWAGTSAPRTHRLCAIGWNSAPAQ